MNATPKKRLKKADVAAALRACGGGVYLAARQLSCEPSTVYRHMQRDPKLAQLVEDIREEMVDIAETGLRAKLIEKDMTAIIWVTKTLGKKRGYVERQEVTGRDGGPIESRQVFDHEAAATAIARRSVPDSDASGESEDRGDGQAVG